MDKLAYHFNKKKKPAKTEGKFLYFYPCDGEDNPDVWYGQKAYIVIEVSEQEWETLFELDRLEYNNLHKYQRHTKRISGKDEKDLTPKQQQRRSDKEIPFNDIINEEFDREILLGNLPHQDRNILELMADGNTQEQAAEDLGVTQGYVSSAVKKADGSMDDYIFQTGTREEIVWYCWNQFVTKGKMPYFYDVQLEFVLRWMSGDLLPLSHWFYSVGELLRYALAYYLFDDDKIDDEIAEYLATANEEDRRHYEDTYRDRPPIVGAVYIRLYREMERRQKLGLQDSDKIFYNIYFTVGKIAKRLKVDIYDFLTQRFYPFVAKWRNKRIRQCYKAFTGKNLPVLPE